MAYKTVKVKYKANQNPFEKGSGSDDFSFSRFTTTPTSAQFSITGTPGSTMVVRDDDTTAGTYQYCIDIEANGQTITSDPAIVNKK